VGCPADKAPLFARRAGELSRALPAASRGWVKPFKLPTEAGWPLPAVAKAPRPHRSQPARTRQADSTWGCN